MLRRLATDGAVAGAIWSIADGACRPATPSTTATNTPTNTPLPTATPTLTPSATPTPGWQYVTYAYGDPAHAHAATGLSTGEGYGYDANGNMTSRVEGGQTFAQTFDAENRLIIVTVSGQTTQFVYDGDGTLVKRVRPDGTSTVYIGTIYEIELSAGGAQTGTTSYYAVPGARVQRTGGSLYYVLTDHLGSASVTLDASGTVVGEQRYYPFGETRLSAGTWPTDRLFTGQRADSYIKLIQMGARWYDPAIGRFVSADTIVPQAGDPQALNRYAYARNDPIKFNDPSGHCWSVFSGVRDLPTYGTTCGNMDMALTIVQHPEASAWNKTVAGAYLVGEVVAHGTAIVYGGVAVCGAVSAACYQAVIAGGTAATSACADGDCTNEAQAATQVTQRITNALARGSFRYNPSLPAGEGRTDALGNITISSRGTLLDRGQALLHEQVHAFFTPRGPLQEARATFSMWAYQKSHLLQYAEEAIAETRAQVLTGGSIRTGLLFPVTNGYVTPWRVAAEGGIVATGTYWLGRRIGELFAE